MNQTNDIFDADTRRKEKKNTPQKKGIISLGRLVRKKVPRPEGPRPHGVLCFRTIKVRVQDAREKKLSRKKIVKMGLE